ncbi:glycosyltransferase family 2 protein [Engelhardtia mirabilis]|uniref:Undecaprenyl-phosphate 4-deoxy-4-formamido-L-arabinose transferase n=1 Tax=Engelhardtia mirabilis TaxID=2528011 RepID=A0A518BL90_9BACT|nr:Undecaprenyl-phosphate 4-deoxy-4-formamido-L-arabinose transferase [Planctomycetes bacterium Pla133]QDV02067.1 Undecaprenyl-phosphate 4-deoxy-4-formamido-L-arabinose transferase [Planctomycetes bacterium Pla86]
MSVPPSAHENGDQQRPEVSVVIPIYRNSATLIELLDRLDTALADEPREYVFVVDGSPDDSLEVLRAQVQSRPHLVVVELARNFGQHAALCAGFEAARGKSIAILDGDLQQRPEELPAFIAAWRAGADFVSGWRTTRNDPLQRRLGSIVLNRFVRYVTGVQLHDWGCPVAVIDRSVTERVATCGEQRRFLKPLVAKLSKRPTELKIEALPRQAGSSAYSSLALLGVTLDFAVSFSNRPFIKLTGLGFLMVAAGVGVGGAYLALRVMHLIDADPRPQAMAVLAAVLGAQLLVLGAMGEFTHRVYRLVQGQPLFEVRHEHRATTSPVAESADSRVR